MGVGMVIVCAGADAQTIKAHVEARGEHIYEIGRIVAGSREVNVV
jgi:phosphoribosylaminoimidazole (AIR) synthetase